MPENENENEVEDGDEDGNEDRELVIKIAATNCRAKLLQYYNKTNNACIIVTILDPRLKMKYYNDNTWNDEQRKEIHEKFLNVYNTTYDCNSKLNLTLSNSSSNKDNNNSITSKYLNKNPTQFSRLVKMAMDYLVIPSTSVCSEEYFSTSKNLITDMHNKLAGKTIRSCMCLKSWLSGSLGDDIFE
ncbi:hypothetical protein C1646_768012 [Rhizophagus diaphanus]|nr:hypothetical protein C1646_768012 [Rhizophagus diaphanus] [Rhizophagus sp. MUCL 43196]